jgi:hypothetical protein
MGPLRAAATRLLILASAAGAMAGCGGSTSTSTQARASTTARAATSAAAWSAHTRQLCTEKRAAIARLGSVHITNGGIAHLGLPKVKALLAGYLDRLLAVLRTFQLRQQQLDPPPPLRAAALTARQIDAESQQATRDLKQQVAAARSPAALSAAFNGWIANLRTLATRGDALAIRLKLSACRSTSSP